MTQITSPTSDATDVRAKVLPKVPEASGCSKSDQETSLSARDNLGAALTFQGKYAEAATVLQENLKARERLVEQGIDTDMMGTLNNLASVLDHLDRNSEAESMFQRILDEYEEKLGPDHEDIIVAKSNLCEVYAHSDRYAKAEQLGRDTIESSKKTHGPEDRTTMILTGNLAHVLHRQNKLDEAEQLMRQVLEWRQASLREGHHATTSAMNNLAAILSHQGTQSKKEEAETLYRQSIALTEADMDKMISISNLAVMLKGQRRWNEAEDLYREALAMSTKLSGPDDPKTRSLATEFGQVLIENGKPTEAEAVSRTVA